MKSSNSERVTHNDWVERGATALAGIVGLVAVAWKKGLDVGRKMRKFNSCLLSKALVS